MVNILDSIIAHKRDLLPNIPLHTNLKKSEISFADALSKPEFGYILECKKASPSKGLIRKDFDIEKIIDIYQHKADAISILTEDRFFRGSFQNLKKARELTGKPLLCKDFILEPKQVSHARFFGADAVLLMMSVLNDFEYSACADQAKLLNMDVLTEIHDEAELQRALNLGAKIIGINNRNLKDLTISLSNTEKLSKLIPQDIIVVTESGISGHQDAQRLSPYADACLVGSQLMASNNLEAQVNELIYGDVKICGVTNQEDFSFLLRQPCNRLGIIFAQKSKRSVMECFYQNIDFSNKEVVGVFQNQPLDFILQKTSEFKLKGVQLHGDETDDFIQELRGALDARVAIYRSITAEMLKNKLSYLNVDEYLVDSKSINQSGGSGEVFDWNKLSALPVKQRRKLRIAGGLTADNIRQLKSFGIHKIDICSGSESAFGVKSTSKIKSLFKQCKLTSRKVTLNNRIKIETNQ